MTGRQPPAVDPRVAAMLDGLAGWVAEANWPFETHAYGPHAEQAADLRLPTGAGPFPVAIVLHGGFWRARFTRRNTAALAVALAQAGWATWNVEYRRSGAGGGVPATLDDVRASADALARLSAPLDLTRVLAIGHSAGGPLALWLAGAGVVSSAVSLAGVCCLADAAREGIGDAAAAGFVGAEPHEALDLYALADPVARLPTGVPQLLVHGAADDRVPIEQSRRYLRRARSTGDLVELVELENADHFDVIDPRGPSWPRILESIVELTSRTGAAR